MNLQTKIELSPDELLQVQDAQWILTKQRILKKVEDIFAEQIPVLNDLFRELFPHNSTRPRISRGENYLGLPYIMLDHPAVFGKEDVFALRTMFWWGKFVSVSLLLSGKYWIENREIIKNNFDKLPSSFYYCIHPSPWHHHLGEDNYAPVKSVKTISDTGFFKITAVHPVAELNRYKEWLQTDYEVLKNLLKREL